MKNVEQTYYASDDSRPSINSKNYWKNINIVTNWLGFAMAPSQGLSGVRLNTIYVMRVKEELDGIRCYVYFACEELVNEKYDVYCEDTALDNDEYHAWRKGKIDLSNKKWKEQSFKKPNLYPKFIKTLDEYRDECFKIDVQYYRKTYLEAIQLFPQYRHIIIKGADFYEYLFETKKELNQYYEQRREKIRKNDCLDEITKNEQAQSLDEDRQRNIDICNFGAD